jgi:hypothetical protein
MLGMVAALWAAVAAGDVGDLQYVKDPDQAAGHSLRIHQLTKPEDPKALALVSPKAGLLGKAGAFRLAFDADKPGAAEISVVRIDAAGKGTFAGAVVLKLRPAEGGGPVSATFGPTTIEVERGGRKVPVLVQGFFAANGLFPAAMGVKPMAGLSQRVIAEGTCAFGEAVRKIRLTHVVPSGGARKLPFTPGAAGSNWGRVADEKGAFPRGTDYPPPPTDLGQPVQVDGAWYVVAVRGLKATAKPLTAEMGTLRVAAPRWRCTLRGKKYSLTVRGGTGPVSVPADSYEVPAARASLGRSARG